MKLITIPAIFLGLLAFSVISFGQIKSEAIPIDEMGLQSCDPLLSRVDTFIAHLKKSPSSKGHVVIYGKANDDFDINRLEFVHGNHEEELRIQFWEMSNKTSTGEWSAIK